MGKCGIKIVGRSRKLRINYRTTEETRRFATAVLEGVSVDDLDGGQDTTNDYRSLLHGRKPEVRGFANQEAQHQWIVDQIKVLTDSGVETQDICVVARTRRLRDQTGEAIANAGLKTCTLEQQQSDNRAVEGVRLATMHRVKGLEFHYMFIASANAGVIPLRQAMSGTEDPVEARQSDLNERALLHVSATRAIRQLFVSSYGQPSPYIASETMA
jgi:superfamily I DNA/RNA helicase